MSSYAVIQTGGKQYRVSEGDVLQVERLSTEAGKNVTLDDVLAISDGKALKVGAPNVSGATVTAEVVDHLRGKKVIAFKKKRRKGYERKVGHRQELTEIKILNIGAAKKAAARKEKAEAAAPAAESKGESDGS